MKTFNLPDLGEGLAEADIQEWHVQEGDFVDKDQSLALVETAKAAVDVPAPFTGKIVKRFGEVGATINTGDPLVGYTDSEQTETEDSATDQHDEAATVVGRVTSDNTVLEPEPAGGQYLQPSDLNQKIKGIRAFPAAKMIAKELKVDLTQVQGTGKQNKITPEDVKRAAERQTTHQSKAAPGFEPIKGFRRTMAQQMIRAHQNVVPATIFDDALIGHWDQQVDVTVRLLRSVINACSQAPYLNAHFDSDNLAIKHFNQVNIGVAVDTENGLYVPVIKNAQDLSDDGLRDQVEQFKDKIKNRTITTDEMEGATITFSNYGSISGRYATPVIVPPMVAIVGVGRLHTDVVPSDHGGVQVERSAPISLTFDHRAATGGEAARFLKAMIDSLEGWQK